MWSPTSFASAAMALSPSTKGNGELSEQVVRQQLAVDRELSRRGLVPRPTSCTYSGGTSPAMPPRARRS
jgi:hypothetical protein